MDSSIVQKIYHILEKRRYNRGAPFLQDRIIRIIENAVIAEVPIPLVGFWGVGSKYKPNFADIESCEFLNSLNDEIKQIYSQGIEFIFIFATLHGLHNGYDKQSIDSYISDMRLIFSQYDFKCILLENLWDKYDISFERIDSLFEQKPKDWWINIPEREIIEKNALRRNKKYPANIAAQKYYIMRSLEKEIFEKEFGEYIFHAFSDPKLKGVLPNLPTLYLWSTGRNHSDAPWFVDSEKK